MGSLTAQSPRNGAGAPACARALGHLIVSGLSSHHQVEQGYQAQATCGGPCFLEADPPTLRRKTLQLSRQLRDQAVEAQACYSLGNTYTLLQDYERAAEYHLRHLLIAQELADRCA